MQICCSNLVPTGCGSFLLQAMSPSAVRFVTYSVGTRLITPPPRPEKLFCSSCVVWCVDVCYKGMSLHSDKAMCGNLDFLQQSRWRVCKLGWPILARLGCATLQTLTKWQSGRVCLFLLDSCATSSRKDDDADDLRFTAPTASDIPSGL